MKRLFFFMAVVATTMLCSCGDDEESPAGEGQETIRGLENDPTFVVGKWELVRTEPTYDSHSWIVLDAGLTFSAYFTYADNPYSENVKGHYSYSNGQITCKDEAGKERTLKFIQITGRDSYNKIRYYFPTQETGRVDSLDFALCKKIQ